ncbi:S53 family peptidase [Roseateles koreensis]|uniref:S53 family peptidase n=1 Tax=Roseateles koreensis TaxID=2987526 RepID=A0ABT5KNX3_9BURK|nr:S53 family peptidase [Roseateles koreensis]MDC8784623.1 S53 family peptidase [Roseateles koreensis]
MTQQSLKSIKSGSALLLPTVLATLLSACGGGQDTSAAQATTQAAATSSVSVTTANSGDTGLAQALAATLPDTAGQQQAQATFHIAPVLLNEPGDTDAQGDNTASAGRQATQQDVPAEFSGMASRGLTVQTLQANRRSSALASSSGESAAPKASTSAVSTYTPAQIRAAYGLPALPAAGATLTTAQAAQLGAGQTIYIVDAKHDPYVLAELAAFNLKFGLPTCTSKAIAASSSLPLATASSTACEFSQVYSTSAGGLTSTVPAYDSGWATEITLDVQWAHATAPLARIVLIEAADASLTNLLGAVKLANAMGPGVVSMSFGATEGSYTASVDAAFSVAKMSYLAATGDNGAAVSWPAVSPNVVAVGGTSLSYSGSGTRSEVTWSGTGGGVSAYTATPSYQTVSVPGMGTPVRRNVADVAFNANPSTGQYVAVQTTAGGAINWVSAGGTSLATPQWAGLLAVANAVRAQANKVALGAPHNLLYQQIATVPGNYASAFADVKTGTDGSCSTCTAKTGYDTPTGLGTPNVTSLLSLSTTLGASTAPVITAGSITGKAGTAFSYAVSYTATNAVTFTLSGAPTGMSISAAGVLSWSKAVAGSYTVTVIVKDSKTGLTGQAAISIKIA